MNKLNLNIDQRNKTYTLHSEGSTIAEGTYSRMEQTSSSISFDSQNFKTKNVNLNWE